MQQSAEVRDAMPRFRDRLSAGDVASFDEQVIELQQRWLAEGFSETR